MYRPQAFSLDDVAILHETIRSHPFATVASVRDGAVAFAYAPVVLDAGESALGTLRFHLARANPLARSDGATLFFSFRGPDAYVSPDWYETKGRVPTWNYIAIEAQGPARRVAAGDLRTLLVDISAIEEAKLTPKPPWSIDKVPAERLAALMDAITGFSVPLQVLAGKLKLSQNTGPADMQGVIAALEARGDCAAAAVARAMREQQKSRRA